MGKAKVYELTPKQRTAWALLENPQYRRYLFDGGARSGKTDCTVAWLISQASIYKGARILMARWKLDHARITLWGNTLKKILPSGCSGVKYHEGSMECHFPNGSMIRIGGLDDADRVDKILGDEYLHIFINEATQVSYDTVSKVMTRLAQPIPNALHKLILDCNPKGPRHWLHQVGIEHILPNDGTKPIQPLPDAEIWARLSWTPYDNPHLPPDALKTLEALPDVLRQRMLLGEWCNNEGLVYDSFDPDIHCFDALPDGSREWRRIRAIDFGFTNPFCCLWGAMDGDGRLWIYREHYAAGVLVEDHARVIKDAENGIFTTVADPEDAEGRATLERCGISTMPAEKTIPAGVQAVQKRLEVAGDGLPRLFVSRDCVNLINEIYQYRWPDTKDGAAKKEEPVKDNDHAMDAMRYMVMEADRPRQYSVDAATDKLKPKPPADSFASIF